MLVQVVSLPAPLDQDKARQQDVKEPKLGMKLICWDRSTTQPPNYSMDYEAV